MKLTITHLDHLSRMIRTDFDDVVNRYSSDFHRYEISLELIELATKLGLSELSEEMRSDLDVEQDKTDLKKEDRDNDTEYNNRPNQFYGR